MTLRIIDHGEDRAMTLEQLIAAVGVARPPARTTMPATYATPSVSPTVYYTGLDTAGNVITSRRTSGVTLASGVYQFDQPLNVVTNNVFDAVWDEGDANDYVKERIVVDT